MDMNELFLSRIKSYLKDTEYQIFMGTLNNPSKNGFTLNHKKLNASTLDIKDLIDKWHLVKDFDNGKYSYYLYDKNLLEKENIYIGKHPLYHAGLYYIQEPSSNMVLRDVDIKEDFKILDMCSAPGGKTIQAAYHINNKKGGMIFSNDIDYKRIKSVYSNIERMGFLDSVNISCDNPKNYLKDYNNYFNLVILDAPCSGEGMIRKNDVVMQQWSENLIYKCAKVQKELIDIAVNLVKSNGILSYSTCTYAKEEDEDNVKYVLDNYKNFDLLNVRKIYHYEGIGEGQFYATFSKK